MFALDASEANWVKTRQTRYIIGAKVPAPGILAKLIASDDELRKDTLPRIVAHNRMLTHYGKMLKDLGLIGRCFLDIDPEHDLIQLIVSQLQALHELIRDARGRI
jgi:hypothetical protein